MDYFWNGVDMSSNQQMLLTSSGSGNISYLTPGSYSFTVPPYSTLTVTVIGGGGGGGGGYNCVDGISAQYGFGGSLSSFNSSIIGYGGNGGSASQYAAGGSAGTGGTAIGGTTNYTGNSGSGSTGGTLYASGGNGSINNCGNAGGGGGGGGKAIKTYSAGQLTVGASIAVVVGDGGIGGYQFDTDLQDWVFLAQSGNSGSVVITWS